LRRTTPIRAPNGAGLNHQGSGEETTVADLRKQRSMLVILIAACQTAQTAFEAAGNDVDSELLADLSKMIERSEAELGKLSSEIDAQS
jgi:hypothetical protein